MLARVENWMKRRMREYVEIEQRDGALNMDGGLTLGDAWKLVK